MLDEESHDAVAPSIDLVRYGRRFCLAREVPDEILLLRCRADGEACRPSHLIELGVVEPVKELRG
jgi:hypothetical protein